MEQAYDDAKDGQFSRRPYIDMVIPTLVDPRMAPPGKHIVSCFVQFAPYKLAEGTWDDQREAFGDAVVDTLAERAPNIRSLILHRQVLTPLDIERTMGLTEGNIFQGELSLEQLFVNRPAPGWARFRTPVRDLWLCGSSAHPGGGIMGAPGRIAALELLREQARGRRVSRGASSGTRSSSVAATTASCAAHTWRAAACARSSWSGATRWAGRWPPAELVPGARIPVYAHTVGRLRGSIARDLGLSADGLRLVQPAARVTSLRADGPPITLWGDPVRTAADLAGISRRDAAAWVGLDAEVTTLSGVLSRLMAITPPDPSAAAPGDILAALRLGLHFRGLDETHARALLRVLPQSIADFLEDRLETDALRALLAVRGIRYSSMGPHSAGTTQVFLADSAGNDGGASGETVYARGGPGALAAALASAARRAGAEIRTGAEVTGVRSAAGRATGVTLASGEQLDAPVVVSGLDPRRTLLDLVDPEVLGPRLGWQAGNLRLSGVTAKVDLALAELPRFTGLTGTDDAPRLRGRLVVAPSVRYLDVAHDAAKYGRMSDEPWLEATIPSLTDPLLVDGAAASGVRHVMSVLVQSAPRVLRDGDWATARDTLLERTIATLETVAPGIDRLVVARQVHTPEDLERDLGMTGGHPLHGEPSLDQWFAWRPMLGYARYRMPLDGLYLCGSGAHPGGGVTGVPGRNAAREVIADRKRT